MPAPGSAYRYTHQDINALMLFPWPTALPISIVSGQVGLYTCLTWRQYLAVLGEFWEKTYRYPRHEIRIEPLAQMRASNQTTMGQVFGLCVQALVERGYLNPRTGELKPPIPFAPPPPEFREPPPGWGS